MPDLLGFNDKTNVEFLHSIINMKFLIVFKDSKKNYAAINKGFVLKRTCKRKAIIILDEISSANSTTSASSSKSAINIMSGIAVSQEDISMDELNVQALAVQFFEI